MDESLKMNLTRTDLQIQSTDRFRRSSMRLLTLTMWLATLLLAAGCDRKPPLRAAGAPAAKIDKLADGDGDGFPDAAELRTFDDRTNFRRWLTAIAENQFYEMSEAWTKEQRDCAGLVRFSVREALRRHDRPWIKAIGGITDPVAPDVRAWTLDNSPLGEKIFRADFGAFSEADLTNGKMSEFADARTLKNYNTVFISRDRREAQPGDLLFFHQPWVQRYPYHVMIFLGAAREAGEGAADWVVYHTGASPDDQGTIKKVRLAVLDRHPNPRWRPLLTNPNFLGFYRLKILD
jgi:uncharacterized protein YfaT (DUF1175 family)